ncbi:hypothetical protein BDV93DRAFT_505702 [Ceratobasidium sp. AG-I]|nr:hypothetical protein BDV93DRAFT_505702 [Ceratobasidium sp. AG-I]
MVGRNIGAVRSYPEDDMQIVSKRFGSASSARYEAEAHGIGGVFQQSARLLGARLGRGKTGAVEMNVEDKGGRNAHKGERVCCGGLWWAVGACGEAEDAIRARAHVRGRHMGPPTSLRVEKLTISPGRRTARSSADVVQGVGPGVLRKKYARV